ncbi:hypothetical protein CRUP_034957 [Coryphaenoides rupestris]|nr:hypothetical protein CRUP_034957 [Coryphaenoides rupestris]
MFLRGRPVTMHVPDAQRDSYSLDLKGAAPDNKLKLQWVLNTLHILGMGVFDRAVTCLAFSKSNGGAHLCAIDDANDHILSVWNWQKEKQLAEVKCSNDSVLGAVFHPTDPNLVKHEKPKYVLCVAFAENGDAITGDSSGNIYVWAKGGSRITHAVSGAHEGGVFSLCVLKDGTMVSGGGKDRQVVLWDHSYVKQCEMEVAESLWSVGSVLMGAQPGASASSVNPTETRMSLRAAPCPDTLTPQCVQGHSSFAELPGLVTFRQAATWSPNSGDYEITLAVYSC